MSGFMESEDDGDIMDFKQINENGYQEVIATWESMYGPNPKYIHEKVLQLKNSLKEFWNFQIEAAEETKKNLMVSIEQMGKEAVELERALGLENKVKDMEPDVPLVEMEESLWKLVDSYRTLKEERMAQYRILQKREEELCNLLEKTTELPKLNDSNQEQTTSNKSPQSEKVPCNEDMVRFEERVKHLEELEAKLKEDFVRCKMMLRDLLNECGIMPFSKVERAAFCDFDTSEVLFPFSLSNLNILKNATQEYANKKTHMVEEADSLRTSIIKVTKKMLKDEDEMNCFLSSYCGFSKNTITKLKEVLDGLKEERKVKLKDLILTHRTLLDELWTKCCYSDQQRAEFRPYYVDYYTEDILDFHELEVEKLELFYNKYMRIFELMDKHKKLWARLLQLEEQSSHTERLFNNRGGRLLLEEKERKTIQKKVPAIKAELVTLLNEFQATTGKDFLYFGTPLLEVLDQMEEDREITKENKKRMRMVQNQMMQQPQASGLMLRSPAAPRIGVGAAAGSYATLLCRTPVPTVRTPAASTPENGSPSYESFQEHLEKSISKKKCRSSTKTADQRVLRPRNLNETVTKTPRVTPYKTPAKTPTRIPFRIATGGKIPSVVPPISPRSATKLTTPRSKLPIIF